MSGLHEAAYCLGNFTGPALAGLLYQKVRKCVDSSRYRLCLMCYTQIGFCWGSVVLQQLAALLTLLNLLQRWTPCTTTSYTTLDQEEG